MILQPVLICSYGAFAAPWPGCKISFDHPVGILTHKSLAGFVPDGIAPDHTATEQNDHRKSDRVSVRWTLERSCLYAVKDEVFRWDTSPYGVEFEATWFHCKIYIAFQRCSPLRPALPAQLHFVPLGCIVGHSYPFSTKEIAPAWHTSWHVEQPVHRRGSTMAFWSSRVIA